MAVPYSQEKFALIEWLGENRFSVLPLCHARDQTRCTCGSSADFKWINPKGKKPAKYYKALILMISENRVKLKRLEQRIINEEITADEVAALAIEETEEKVDSTTPEKDTTSQIGTLPSLNRKRIFSDMRDGSPSHTPSCTSTPRTSESKKKCSKDSGKVVQKIHVYGEKVHNSFKHFNATCTDVGLGPELDDSGITDDILDPKELEIQKLKAEIKCLKETAYNTLSSTRKEKSNIKPHPHLPSELQKKPELEPNKILLTPGHDVYIQQSQMDEAVDMSGSSPTKLIRNILMVFFSPQTLANSSAFGTRKFPALDKPILRACLNFVMDRFPGKVSRSVLVDAVNDKCANYRRLRSKK